MNTWKEFDEMIEIETTSINEGLLKTHLTVILIKNMVSYQTPLGEIQYILKTRYDVEYELSDIEDELVEMKHAEKQELLGNDVIELEEDFFEGY